MFHLPCIEIVSVITLSSARFHRGLHSTGRGQASRSRQSTGGWYVYRAPRVGGMTHIRLPEQIARDKGYKTSVHKGDEGGSRCPTEVAPAVFV
jgi:hypothetical protein